MKERIPMRGGLEPEALTGWKRLFHWRAGMRKAAKKAYARRLRKRLRRDVGRDIEV